MLIFSNPCTEDFSVTVKDFTTYYELILSLFNCKTILHILYMKIT